MEIKLTPLKNALNSLLLLPFPLLSLSFLSRVNLLSLSLVLWVTEILRGEKCYTKHKSLLLLLQDNKGHTSINYIPYLVQPPTYYIVTCLYYIVLCPCFLVAPWPALHVDQVNKLVFFKISPNYMLKC